MTTRKSGSEFEKIRRQGARRNGDDGTTASRRRLLKVLAAGGAAAGMVRVPERWTRPVLEKAVLPAHAVTTPAPETDCELRCRIDVVNSNEGYTIDGSGVSAGPMDVSFDSGDSPVFSALINNRFVSFRELSAIVDPPDCVDEVRLTAAVVAGTEVEVRADGGEDQTAPVNPGTGVATFSEVTILIPLCLPGGGSIEDDVRLRFQADGLDDCDIVVTFEETAIPDCDI